VSLIQRGRNIVMPDFDVIADYRTPEGLNTKHFGCVMVPSGSIDGRSSKGGLCAHDFGSMMKVGAMPDAGE